MTSQVNAPAVLLNQIIPELREKIVKGRTTKELEALFQRRVEEEGAEAFFLGYRGYPAAISTSINDEVVYGIPSERRLVEGDILKLEVGLKLNGLHAFQAWSFPVGQVSPEDSELLVGARESLEEACKQVFVANSSRNISKIIHRRLRRRGLNPSRDYVGFRIGVEAHMEPAIPGYVKILDQKGTKLEAGMVLSVLVVAHSGASDTVVGEDGWVATSADSKNSALFSHMVEVAPHEGRILTARYPSVG